MNFKIAQLQVNEFVQYRYIFELVSTIKSDYGYKLLIKGGYVEYGTNWFPLGGDYEL